MVIRKKWNSVQFQFEFISKNEPKTITESLAKNNREIWTVKFLWISWLGDSNDRPLSPSHFSYNDRPFRHFHFGSKDHPLSPIYSSLNDRSFSPNHLSSRNRQPPLIHLTAKTVHFRLFIWSQKTDYFRLYSAAQMTVHFNSKLRFLSFNVFFLSNFNVLESIPIGHFDSVMNPQYLLYNQFHQAIFLYQETVWSLPSITSLLIKFLFVKSN